MITLAADLVQQFYTHQQVRDNQAVMITSFKKNVNHFLDEFISKGRIFGGAHAHTGPKVVLNAFKSFRCENLKKNEIDSESACSEDSASLFKIKMEGLQVKLL
jgi:hypothetical protein